MSRPDLPGTAHAAPSPTRPPRRSANKGPARQLLRIWVHGILGRARGFRPPAARGLLSALPRCRSPACPRHRRNRTASPLLAQQRQPAHASPQHARSRQTLARISSTTPAPSPSPPPPGRSISWAGGEGAGPLPCHPPSTVHNRPLTLAAARASRCRRRAQRSLAPASPRRPAPPAAPPPGLACSPGPSGGCTRRHRS
jgi:hypothetical protein